MGERAREPLFLDEVRDEVEPQPETSSAGGVRPPGRTGSGLWDDDRDGGERWRSAYIEDLNLSMRAYNCLRRSGLTTIDKILEKSEEDLLSLRNFGRKSYDELRERLEEIGVLPAGAPWGTGRRGVS